MFNSCLLYTSRGLCYQALYDGDSWSPLLSLAGQFRISSNSRHHAVSYTHLTIITLDMSLEVFRELGERFLIISHTMRFEVCLGSHIDTIFITEVIPARIIRIMTCLLYTSISMTVRMLPGSATRPASSSTTVPSAGVSMRWLHSTTRCV